VSTQTPAHTVCPPAHELVAHVPLAQDCPPEHTVPHVPQFAVSTDVNVHVPPHRVSGAVHPHALPEHT